MAADAATMCPIIHAEYERIMSSLSSLPVGGSISEGGRSISAPVAELEARLKLLADQADKFGCPIVTQGAPFVVTSRARP